MTIRGGRERGRRAGTESSCDSLPVNISPPVYPSLGAAGAGAAVRPNSSTRTPSSGGAERHSSLEINLIKVSRVPPPPASRKNSPVQRKRNESKGKRRNGKRRREIDESEGQNWMMRIGCDRGGNAGQSKERKMEIKLKGGNG